MINKIIILLLISFSGLLCQSNPGTRETGLSHSDASSDGTPFSIFGNPAGTFCSSKIRFGIYISPSPFGLKELSNGFIAYSHRTGIGSLGFGIMHLGSDLYQENNFLFSYSAKINSDFLFGFAIKSQNTTIRNYGSYSAFDLSFGTIYNLENIFQFGFNLTNILRIENRFIDPPFSYRIGINYLIPQIGSLFFSIQKENNFPISPRIGIEYFPLDFLGLQFGIMSEPMSFSSGFSVEYDFLKIGFALNSHRILGFTYQADIISSIE